jgi:hypothetical protein
MAITEQDYSNLLDERNELLWKVERLRAALGELISAVQADCDETEHYWLYEQVEKARKALANEQDGE